MPTTVAPLRDDPTEGELDDRELTDRIEHLTWLCASAPADLDRPGALGYLGTLSFER